MNRRALEGREKTLGKKHPNTLASVNDLAWVLFSQGKYGEAEKMNRRALKWKEKALGKEHPDTVTSVSNLAGVLYRQGKNDEAEEMNRRALKWREKALGKEHPDTLTSVSNLALVLFSQGKYDAAEEMNRRALEGRERGLGKEHPNTLANVNDLAWVLYRQGKYDEAEEMNRAAIICDGCDTRLPNSDSYYHCSICGDDNFDLCQKCIDKGVLCPGDCHQLTKRRCIENNKLIDVDTDESMNAAVGGDSERIRSGSATTEVGQQI